MKKLIFFLIIVFGASSMFAQTEPDEDPYYLSPNGLMDNIFDQYGNKYKLSDIKIEYERTIDNVLSRNEMLCSSGMFELYFETGSGMEDTSNATHNARRAVVCQVFQDLSDFINSPLKNPDNFTRVKIWVRNINSVVDSPNGVLGSATSFFNVPYNSTVNFGGIADNEIWKTIHAGVDSYINVAAPVVSGSDAIGSGIYYHGLMAFNFNTNNSPAINWNTDLSVNPPTGQHDLYTVVLHEVTHALGIASLIDENGTPVFGTGYNYFSRYDRFLKNNASTEFLINNTGSCSMYNYTFNTNLSTSVLHPGGGGCVTDQTICSSAIKFVGSNIIPVYTPNCFDEGSSLSHFEDECVAPNVNNAYFAMSNRIGTGVNKRFLKPEERAALCDIGYSVNTTYGNTSQLSYKNYGGTVCTGIQVAGINDGINSDGTLAFIGNSGTDIVISGILNNDFTTNANDLRFECLQDVYDAAATFSVTGGTSVTPVTFNSAIPGIHLLRYIPYNNATLQRGNITYIYVYVKNLNNCAVPNACNLVMNGDFEQYSSVPSFFEELNKACGWNSANSLSPHYFHAGTTYPFVGVPCNTFGSESDNIVENSAYSGFSMTDYGTYKDIRNMVTTLTTPLLPNTTYQLSFDVSRGERYSLRYMKPQVYFSTSFFVTAGYGDMLIPNPNMLFETTHYPTTSDGWERVKIIITTGPVAGEKYLYLGALNDTDLSELVPSLTPPCTLNGGNIHQAKYYLDNIELVPLNGADLNFPEEHCQNVILSNLSSYVVSAPSNGVFSGPGVTVAGGVYSFSASVAGLGTHSIVYTYTNTSGCIVSISSNITVLDCTFEPEDPCPNVLIFTTPELATEEIYQAFGTITTHTNYVVSAGSDIIFKGGKSITFNPDSLISYGSDFSAYLENCFFQRGTNTENSMEDEKSLLESEAGIKLNIYPNPTNGLVTIASADIKMSRLTIASIDGKITHNVVLNSVNSYELNVSNYETGMYIVTVESTHGKIYSEKLIKN